MEYADKGDLENYISMVRGGREGEGIGESVAAEWVRQLLSALSYLHGRWLIHTYGHRTPLTLTLHGLGG